MLRTAAFFIFLSIGILSKAQIVSVDSIGGYLGKNVTIYGRVDDGRYLNTSSNQPTLLNMGGKYPNQKITIVIYGPDRVNFGYKPEEMLLNKNIYVTGMVQLYNGKPQIQVKNPFSISFSAPSSAAVTAVTAAQPIIEKAIITRQGKAEEKGDKVPRQKAEQRAKTNKTESAKTKAPTMQVVQSPTLSVNGEFVLNSSVSLRGGPGNNFNTIASLKKGTLVRVVSSSYGWIKIAEKTPSEGNAIISGYVKQEKLK